MEDRLHQVVDGLLEEVSKIVIGMEDLKELLLVALLSGGHILIEGPAGTAKTTLARTFAQALGGIFKRIQFTPDMLPSDVTGFYLYTPAGESRFIPGPVFANVLLADELNRTTPRTQSALLEAMQEGRVTVEGETYILPQPFVVIATQLRYGAEGTYPLTEVQSDRFVLKAESDYPSPEGERQIIERIDFLERPEVAQIVSPEAVLELRQAVSKVFVSPEVENYIVGLVNKVRHDGDVVGGAGPRASIALYKGARALAFLERRDFVLPDDVKRLALPALRHRVRVRPEAEMDGITPEDIIGRALEGVAVPK
jgi:MoxR-like ATPase